MDARGQHYPRLKVFSLHQCVPNSSLRTLKVYSLRHVLGDRLSFKLGATYAHGGLDALYPLDASLAF